MAMATPEETRLPEWDHGYVYTKKSGSNSFGKLWGRSGSNGDSAPVPPWVPMPLGHIPASPCCSVDSNHFSFCVTSFTPPPPPQWIPATFVWLFQPPKSSTSVSYGFQGLKSAVFRLLLLLGSDPWESRVESGGPCPWRCWRGPRRNAPSWTSPASTCRRLPGGGSTWVWPSVQLVFHLFCVVLKGTNRKTIVLGSP